MSHFNDVRYSQSVYSLFLRMAYRLPYSLLYSPEAILIMKLLKKVDCGDDIENDLKKRLVYILGTALTEVPYYRELKIGLSPQDIRLDNVYEALKQFPFLEKATIMERPYFFVNRRVNLKKLMVDTSGGSTGVGVKLYSNYRTKIIERSFFDYRWNRDTGFKHSSRTMRMGLTPTNKNPDEAFAYMAGRLFVSPYHINDKWIGAIYQEVRDYQVEYIHSYPSCMEFFVRYMRDNDLKLEHIKGIFLGSERIHGRQMDIIREVFGGIPVVFHYGLREKSNLAWGSYVDASTRYTFEKVYGYTENFVHNDGMHEIVGTSYWDDVMPLIRYRTQDMGKIENGTIMNLDGREQEFLLAKSGALIPGFTISIDKFTWEYVSIFQVVQNEPGKIEFHIVPRATFNPEVESRILESQTSKWGSFFDMKIVLKNEIPKTHGGKLRLIINNLERKRQ